MGMQTRTVARRGSRRMRRRKQRVRVVCRRLLRRLLLHESKIWMSLQHYALSCTLFVNISNSRSLAHFECRNYVQDWGTGIALSALYLTGLGEVELPLVSLLPSLSTPNTSLHRSANMQPSYHASTQQSHRSRWFRYYCLLVPLCTMSLHHSLRIFDVRLRDIV